MSYTNPSSQSGRRTEREWREEIVRVCRLMWEKDYVAASDGNVSVRLGPDHFLVTPSGFSKGHLKPDQLLVIDWDAKVVGPLYGANRDLRPSSEIILHLEAYRRRPDIRSVVHAHPPMAVALSIAGVSLAQCILPEVVMTLGLIPTTRYATPASPEGAEVIAGLIEHYDALILKRHGSVTVGESAWKAYLKLEKLEHTALITKTLVELNRLNPMKPEETAKAVHWRESRGLLNETQAHDLCNVCEVCPLAT
ncbi:MAG TPA: class II aldolase/adducin family protein [Anaerolineae bacterium]|nr:class II aldolase/adducin family protein [Caldilineae bacterium]HID34354.1 class II aldolase/adducin family protein [Anaerolineae bacterium]HIQ12085.1 class II aldolase/adducin family protein [Caldilineales bacterium]